MKKGKSFYFFSIVFLLSSLFLKAQYNSTTYYMQNLPQSAILNPAIQPGCSFYLSLPGISMDIKNSALSFYDVIYHNEVVDSFYTPFHAMASQADKDDFLNKLKDINTISSSFNINIFGIGFRVEDSYIGFHMAERLNTNIDFPRDIFRMIMYGNGEPGIYDWSGFGGRINLYQEIGLSYSKKIDNITYGARGKLLFGQMDFGVSKQNIRLDVDTFRINIASQFELNGSAPIVNVVSTNDVVDSVYFGDLDGAEITALMLGKKNMGFGLDFGVDYKMDRLGISASILDLGIIRWKKNVFNISSDASFEYLGTELELFGNENEEDTANFFTSFVDSVKNTFALNSSNSAYSTYLTSKILIGLNYKLHDRLDFGLLTYTEIYRTKFYPRVTLSANIRPFRFLNTSFSYSLLNKEYYNLGFGLSFKPGPFNWYIIGDTYPMVLTKGTPIPVYSKGFRIQAGFNFAFGVKKKNDGENDMPLMEW